MKSFVLGRTQDVRSCPEVADDSVQHIGSHLAALQRSSMEASGLQHLIERYRVCPPENLQQLVLRYGGGTECGGCSDRLLHLLIMPLCLGGFPHSDVTPLLDWPNGETPGGRIEVVTDLDVSDIRQTDVRKRQNSCNQL